MVSREITSEWSGPSGVISTSSPSMSSIGSPSTMPMSTSRSYASRVSGRGTLRGSSIYERYHVVVAHAHGAARMKHASRRGQRVAEVEDLGSGPRQRLQHRLADPAHVRDHGESLTSEKCIGIRCCISNTTRAKQRRRSLSVPTPDFSDDPTWPIRRRSSTGSPATCVRSLVQSQVQQRVEKGGKPVAAGAYTQKTEARAPIGCAGGSPQRDRSRARDAAVACGSELEPEHAGWGRPRWVEPLSRACPAGRHARRSTLLESAAIRAAESLLEADDAELLLTWLARREAQQIAASLVTTTPAHKIAPVPREKNGICWRPRRDPLHWQPTSWHPQANQHERAADIVRS